MHELPRGATGFGGWRRSVCAVLVCVAVVIALPGQGQTQTPSGFDLLARGVNYGNMLEAPREGDWGLRFDNDYPRLVKAAGFHSVRIPVRWSSHTAPSEPFDIEPEFVARVKSIVDLNLRQGLQVVLNVHHFEELYANPRGERKRFLAIWRQLSRHFQDADEHLFFELLNEPHDKLSAREWNELLTETLAEIRKLHPQRWIIVGPDQWNSLRRLTELKLPAEDRRLIVTVHYYLPFAFTHQGASWVHPPPPTGKSWTGSPEEDTAIERDFAAVARWARENNRPIYVGEFGAYSRADLQSREKWTRKVRRTCQEQGFAWAYWELAAGFGILDPATKQWRNGLLEALHER